MRTMLTASCLVMFPISFSTFKNSWNLKNVEDNCRFWLFDAISFTNLRGEQIVFELFIFDVMWLPKN